MLAGQTAAHIHAKFQHLRAKGFADFQIAGLVGVIANQGVHVAIARMKHIAHGKPIFLGHLTDAAQHIGQFRYRDRAVQTHVVAHTTNGGKGSLATRPNTRAFLGRGAFAQRHGIMPFGNFGDQGKLGVNLGLRAFDLYDQQRLAKRIIRLGKILTNLDQHLVHKLNGHRQNTGFDDVGHASARNFGTVKPHQDGARALGLVQDAQSGFGHNAQLPLRSADDAQQI
mmetsp:Transcript_28308/g.52687  ORF Transcript_28308/g.52687 Transcript_28308/m.52687 type:complete len:226 (-) Transcript_28308:701-1378(-)